MPAPGFYGVLYNYGYMTDQLNDPEGNGVESVTIQPGPGTGATIDVDVDVDVYALAPTLIWISNYRSWGHNTAPTSRRVSTTRASVPPSQLKLDRAVTRKVAVRRRRPVPPAALAGLGANQLGLCGRLRLLRPHWQIRHGDHHPAGHWFTDRRSDGQHRTGVLDTPAPRCGIMVSVGGQTNVRGDGVDLRDSWREGRFQSHSRPESHAEPGR